MADQNDDRISSFINRDGIKEDVQYMIDSLELVKKSLNELNTIKLTLFGSNTVSQVIESLKLLNAQNDKLVKSQMDALKMSLLVTEQKLKETRITDIQTRAMERLLAAEDKSNKAANKTSSGGGGGGGGGGGDDLTRFQELQAATKAAKLAYNDLLAARAAGESVSHQEISQARDDWKALELQMRDVAKITKTAFDPEAINKMESKLSSLRSQLTATKDRMRTLAGNGDTKSSLFASLSVDAAQYEGKIKLLERELAKLSRQERERQSIAAQSGKIEKQILAEFGASKVLGGAYEELKAELKALQQEALNLSALQVKLAASGQNLSKAQLARLAELNIAASDMAVALAKMEGQAGKGAKANYAYTQQLFSLQQVLRETPNLAFGWNIFLASLSNNIPILADDIKRLKDRNKELAASGQPVVSVTKQILNALGSWTSVIAYAVAIVTIFGAKIVKWVGDLFRSEAAIRANYLASQKYLDTQKLLIDTLSALTDVQKKLNDIVAEGNKKAIRDLEKTIELQDALGVSIEKTFDNKKKLLDLKIESSALGKADLANQLRNEPNLVTTDVINDKVSQINAIDEQITKLNKKIKEGEKLGVFEDFLKGERAKLKTLGAMREAFLVDQKNLEIDYNNKTNEKVLSDEELLIRNQERQKQKYLTKNQQLQDLQLKIELNSGSFSDKELKKMKTLESNLQAEVNLAEKKYKIIEDVVITHENNIKEKEKEIETEKRVAREESIQLALTDAKKSAEKTIAINQKVLNDELSTYSKRVAAINAIADANNNLANAQSKAVQDSESSPATKRAAEDAAASSVFATNTQRTTDLENLRIQFADRRIQALRQDAAERKRIELELEDQITQGTVANLEQRNKALTDSYRKRKEEIDLAFAEELKLAQLSDDNIKKFIGGSELPLNNQGEIEGSKKTYEELKAMRQKYFADIGIQNSGFAKSITQVLLAEITRTTQLVARQTDEIQIAQNAALEASGRVIQEDLIAQQDLFRSGKISFAEMNREMERLSRQANEDRLKITAESLDKEIAQFQDAGAEKLRATLALQEAIDKVNNASAESDIVAAKNEQEVAQAAYDSAVANFKHLIDLMVQRGVISKEQADLILGDINREQDARNSMVAYSMTLVQQLNDFSRSLAESLFARKMQMIDEELAALEKKADRERAIIEQSILNEEDKSKALAELEIQRANQQEVLEARKRKIARDAAIAQKAASVSGILIQLAASIFKIQAEAAALPLVGKALLAQIPFLIAGSALAVGAVLAQPLPKLKHGTKDFAGGRAILGDGGKSELVLQPDGSMFVSGSSPEIHSLLPHSVVLPDAKAAIAASMATAKGVTDGVIGLAGYGNIALPGFEILNSTMHSGFANLSKTIKNKPEIILRRGMNKDLLLRYGADYYKYIN